MRFPEIVPDPEDWELFSRYEDILHDLPRWDEYEAYRKRTRESGFSALSYLDWIKTDEAVRALPSLFAAPATPAAPDVAALNAEVARLKAEMAALVDRNQQMDDTLYRIHRRADDLVTHASGAFEVFLKWVNDAATEAPKSGAK